MKISRTIFTLTSALILGFSIASCSNNKKGEATNSTNSPAEVELVADDEYEDGVDGESGATPYVEGQPTVIDFYATWCGPCKMISPVFDELRDKYQGKGNFVRVDVDKDADKAREYGIEAMPTFVFLDKDGKEVDRLVGADQDELVSKTKALLD